MLPLQNNLEHFGSLYYVYYMTGFKNEEESYQRNIYYCKDHLLNIEYRVHPFFNLQSRARTHAVLMIELCELLGNPTYLTHLATRALKFLQ
jgi:hypothetical protein